MHEKFFSVKRGLPDTQNEGDKKRLLYVIDTGTKRKELNKPRTVISHSRAL